MGNTSKDLLQLEHKKASTSPLESTLLVCKNASTKKAQPEGKPIPALPLPGSQVLGQVRDFLGVISEANEQLYRDAKDNPENYDIEVLTGNESEVINMELMLGVADLQTPEAVTAAESAISGCQPVIPLAVNSSGEESEDSSDDDSSSKNSDDEDSSDDSNSEDSDDIKDDTSDKDDKKTCSHAKLKTREPDQDNSLSEDVGNNRSKKRPRIVELMKFV
ncbi:trigger factor-like isoform X1 [Pyrus x bretschneideri]|uniref:trigger factor-like isoform X1 n=1 Tax=Pyrus x bretschneideri TaxID=225117 RepID=UPI00202E783E|nr:trigger factor-like isoform X1 [Pyrus x bretschneideri]